LLRAVSQSRGLSEPCREPADKQSLRTQIFERETGVFAARDLRMQKEGRISMGSLGNLAQPLLLLGVFVFMYFLMIAPQQKKQKKWQQMLGELKVGDRVTTNGGIRGTIVSIKDDAVQLKIAPDNVKMEFVKSAIAAVTVPDAS
jgi:preprotein translocase subunit YajC